MIKLKIDKREVEAKEGAPLIEVIRGTGTEVPSMCYLEGMEHFTSCMVCVVKERSSGKMIPSCSRSVEEGMDIITMDDEVHEARKTALDLMLSEHVGDCEAPCQITCPAHMDIPLMNRLLARGEFSEALKVVKKDIALAAVLGRICPAPCEGSCRRKPIDGAVSICLLKRYAGDHDLESDPFWIPERAASTGKKVAVVGAGPAGLAAAYHLSLFGHDCVVLDRNSKPGGSLRREVPADQLPLEVLDREIETIAGAGVSFGLGVEVDRDMFGSLTKEYDAVVVAAGKGETGIASWGLPVGKKGVEADQKSYQVGERSVFVVGSALKPSRMAIRALGQGKEVAYSVDQLLSGKAVRGEHFMFNSRFGKLLPEENLEYLKESAPGDRIEPEHLPDGFTPEQVMTEAARCLHCDCRDLHQCKLRIYSDTYGADQKRFRSDDRVPCRKMDQHDAVIYEPSKCIKCGICVRIAEKHKEKYGMTFIGRGFEVVVGIPFNEDLGHGLQKAALEAARACPTGALSEKSKVENLGA
jgi:ferredoxin